MSKKGSAMFGWFAPQCPVNPEEKIWAEESMNWLVGQFGREPFTKPTILPTAEFFPEPYDSSFDSIRSFFYRICPHMGVSPERVNVRTYNEHIPVEAGEVLINATGTGGLFFKEDKFIVGVNAALAESPILIASVLAHELAHVRLLGENRIDPKRPDGEPLTDLTAIFFGMGIFTANTAFDDQQVSSYGYLKWSVSRRGYLSEPLIGYALALYAWGRGEIRPPWIKHIRPNVRCHVKSGLHYLQKTQDTAFS